MPSNPSISLQNLPGLEELLFLGEVGTEIVEMVLDRVNVTWMTIGRDGTHGTLPNVLTMKMTGMDNLRYITIGPSCFQRIRGINFPATLKELEIGDDSLQKVSELVLSQ